MNKAKYIYENHMGGIYALERKLTQEETHCRQCGDSDWLIGCATTKEEAWNLLKEQTDTFDESLCKNCPHAEDYNYCDNECENYKRSGGWDYDYVQELINDNWQELK